MTQPARSNVVSLLVRKPDRELNDGVKPIPLTQPLMVPTGYRQYRLAREWSYVWRDDLLRHKITVPCDYESDGVSVPRIAWALTGILPDGLIRAAALVHDYLYMSLGFPALYFQSEPNSEVWRRVRRQFTREEADKLFHQIMREAGVGSVRAWIAYRGVRSAFWLGW